MKTDQTKTQEANPQDGPIYGPLTEKEHLRAIKQEAEERLAAIFDNYMEAKSALPPEPSKKECDFAFGCWLQANHRAAWDYEQKKLCYDDRQQHQAKVIEPLFEQWAGSEEGRHIGGARLAWEKAKAAIEADYKAARAPHEAAIEEARQRWDEIQRIEDIRDMENKIIARRKAALREAIGFELCRDIDLDHYDFDRAAYEQYMAWVWWPDDGSSPKNAMIVGAPRLGKTRAMASMALNVVHAYEDEGNKIEWITAAKFADLVTAMGNNDEREAARRHLRRLAAADHLFFDDLGAVHFTDAGLSHFMALIDARYAPGLPTHFTTNFSVEEMRQILSGKHGNKMLADRLLGRIIGTEAEPRAEVFQFKRRSRPAAKGRKPAAVC
jgi:DNA replication protein DnaC